MTQERDALFAIIQPDTIGHERLKYWVTLQAELATMTQERDGWKAMQDTLYYQPLAEAQAYAEQLREVLEELNEILPVGTEIAALALPRDTVALDVRLKQERERIQGELAEAISHDCENGVRWLNQRAAEDFLKNFPELNAAIRALT